MDLKKLLLFICIFVVIPAYFLYTPIPDGYSTMSACKMQLTLATVKAVGAVVGTFSETFCNALEIGHHMQAIDRQPSYTEVAEVVIFLALLLTIDLNHT